MHEVIRLDNVSLWRRTQEEFSYDLKKTVLSMFEGKYQKPSKRLVINDLSFSIQKGEKVGIIGSKMVRAECSPRTRLALKTRMSVQFWSQFANYPNRSPIASLNVFKK